MTLEERIKRASLLLAKIQPKVPNELIQIQELMSKPNPNLKDFCALVMQSPDFHGLLVQTANEICTPDIPFTDVKKIAHIYGLYPTYSLYVSLFIEKTFSQSPEERFAIQYSRNAAIACSQLAYWIYDVTPPEAYLIGLMHNIGWIMGLRLSKNYCKIINKQIFAPLSGYAIEDKLLSTTHSHMGAILLKRWGLNSDASKAILLHHDKDYLAKTAQHPKIRDLCAMLMLSNFIVVSHTDLELITPELITYRDLAKQGLEKLPKQAIKAAQSALERLGHPLELIDFSQDTETESETHPTPEKTA
jgi:HD-like signal output (HDOD) protein